MEELTEERVSYVGRIRLRLKNLLLLLIGAIVFAFLMSVLANILVNHYMLGAELTPGSVYLIASAIAALVAISYGMYYAYVFAPHSRIAQRIGVRIIYNRVGGFVIRDPFDGYHPQQMAWQAFERFKKRYPNEARAGIQKGIPPRTAGKHLLTELLEYLIVLDLSKGLYGFGQKGLMPDKTIAGLPDQLEKNSFVTFFRTLESKDIVDRGMSELEFILPEDIVIKYWSPAPIKGLLPDPNSFRIGFVGRYCEIYMTGRCTSLWPVQTMRCGPAPIFEGVYIRRYFQEELLEDLSKLWRTTFVLTTEARFKLRSLFSPPSGYMNWAERWIEEFIKGRFFGGFDFEEFRKEKTHTMEYDSYETIKMIDVRLDEIEDKISTMSGKNSE